MWCQRLGVRPTRYGDLIQAEALLEAIRKDSEQHGTE